MKHLTSVKEINELQPKILEVIDLSYSTLLFKTDKGFFILETEQYHDDATIQFADDLLDWIGPQEVVAMGLYTQQEADDWQAKIDAEQARREAAKENYDYQEYLKLKKRFEK